MQSFASVCDLTPFRPHSSRSPGDHTDNALYEIASCPHSSRVTFAEIKIYEPIKVSRLSLATWQISPRPVVVLSANDQSRMRNEASHIPDSRHSSMAAVGQSFDVKSGAAAAHERAEILAPKIADTTAGQGFPGHDDHGEAPPSSLRRSHKCESIPLSFGL
jgi:hypothetical protein